MTWRYYRMGAGEPILWLTGGLRRAALGFAFMERQRLGACGVSRNNPGTPLTRKDRQNHADGELVKFISLPEAEWAEWLEAIYAVMKNDLS